jgi:putative MATE family efflux protein
MALPIACAIAVPQLNFIINNIFLSGLGEEKLATAAVTGVYYLIFAVAGMGLNNGLQTLIARRAGEDKLEDIGVLFRNGVLIAVCTAFVFILFTKFCAPWFFSLTIHSKDILDRTLSFLNIRIWGLFFLYIYQLRNALLVGTNQTRWLVIGTLAEAIINIFLDYGFIYGHFGLPTIGFNGAAYASIIAEFTGLVVIFLAMKWLKLTKGFQLLSGRFYSLNHIKLILKTSTPLVAQYMISVFTWQVFFILIEHHGSQALAISATVRNVFGFFGVFSWAFGATANSMVSNIIGQGRSKEVMYLIRKISKWSLGFTLVIFTFLNIFPGMFLSIYGMNEDFIMHAIPVFRVVSFALIVMSIGTVHFNAVTGTGATRINLFIDIIVLIAYMLYSYLVLEYFHLSIVLGWASEILYWGLILTLSYFYLQRRKDVFIKI